MYCVSLNRRLFFRISKISADSAQAMYLMAFSLVSPIAINLSSVCRVSGGSLVLEQILDDFNDCFSCPLSAKGGGSDNAFAFLRHENLSLILYSHVVHFMPNALAMG